MQTIKVLIADDSGVYRSMIRSAFEGNPRFEVVGAVASGRLAIDKLVTSPVDLLILDLEMPDLDGLGTLREMAQKEIKCRTLVFSSLSLHGAQCTLTALELGATDFITKPGHEQQSVSPLTRIREALLPKIESLFPVAPEAVAIRRVEQKISPLTWELFKPRVVLIGSSTGGPTVLETIFSQLRGTLACPIIIAQHMPPLFTATLAERLSRASGLFCAEAKHGEALLRNRVYIAPGDFHLRLTGTASDASFTLDKGPQIQSVRPAVDPLFETAASIFKDKCLAFVLTGMGQDGRDGAQFIKKQGGLIAIQDKASCTVFGMPGAVYEAGLADLMGPPEELIRLLREKALETSSVSQSVNPLTRKVSC